MGLISIHDQQHDLPYGVECNVAKHSVLPQITEEWTAEEDRETSLLDLSSCQHFPPLYKH